MESGSGSRSRCSKGPGRSLSEHVGLEVGEHLIVLAVAHSVRIHPQEGAHELLEEQLLRKRVQFFVNVVRKKRILFLAGRRGVSGPRIRFGGGIGAPLLDARVGHLITARPAENHLFLHLLHEDFLFAHERLGFAHAAHEHAEGGRHPAPKRRLILALETPPRGPRRFQPGHGPAALRRRLVPQRLLVHPHELPPLAAGRGGGLLLVRNGSFRFGIRGRYVAAPGMRGAMGRKRFLQMPFAIRRTSRAIVRTPPVRVLATPRNAASIARARLRTS